LNVAKHLVCQARLIAPLKGHRGVWFVDLLRAFKKDNTVETNS